VIVHRSLPSGLVARSFARPFRRTSLTQLLVAAAIANAVLIFSLIASVGGPRLPVGQDFYLSIVLAALALGTLGGVGAGLLAVVLFEVALVAKGSFSWSRALSDPDGVRLASYLAVGIVVGAVSQRGRRLLNDSLHHLDALLTLAGRDLATAALDTRGLRRALDRRLAADEPFSLLVLELSLGRGLVDDDVRWLAALLESLIAPGDELARLGASRFAILASARSEREVRVLVDSCRRALDEAGFDAAFGWALPSPVDADGLILFSDALGRLYAELYASGRVPVELAEATA
jgi:hypothetical protein